ncbi:hypothetical protein HNY73_004572 [Argiope bruennichi]|uniref:Uncharacterized protein n=1 Tax=Argiope bruennichi TaxID=94029 RepID=A0A8T0FW95_ARGBR|nr:hypothetical protein HNY73_004572 [Argiope bruennichi]
MCAREVWSLHEVGGLGNVCDGCGIALGSVAWVMSARTVESCRWLVAWVMSARTVESCFWSVEWSDSSISDTSSAAIWMIWKLSHHGIGEIRVY